MAKKKPGIVAQIAGDLAPKALEENLEKGDTVEIPSLSTDEAPRWRDGYPENLAAAALDALEWLVWLDKRLDRIGPDWEENRARLRGCIDELKAFIPKGEDHDG